MEERKWQKNPYVDGVKNIVIPDCDGVCLEGFKGNNIFGIESKIDGNLDLSGIKVKSVDLTRSIISGDFNLNSARSEYVGLSKSTIGGNIISDGDHGQIGYLNLESSKIAGKMWLLGGEECNLNYVNLENSKIKGDLRIYADYTHELNLKDARVGGKIEIEPFVYYTDRSIFDLDRIKTTNVSFGFDGNCGKFKSAQINMRGAEIKDDVRIGAMGFGNFWPVDRADWPDIQVDISNSYIGGDLFLDDINGIGGINLRNTKVGRGIKIEDVELMDAGLKDPSPLNRGILILNGAKISDFKSLENLVLKGYSIDEKTEIPQDLRDYLGRFPQVEIEG